MNEYKIDEEGLNRHREQTVKEIQELLAKYNRVACVRYTGYGKSYHIVRKIIEDISRSSNHCSTK